MREPEYFNRDLSWLEFNKRVLFQAQDQSLPLLERLRFLSIATSNQDEFFMKRVGYLKRVIRKGITRTGSDHASPTKIFNDIRVWTSAFLSERHQTFQGLVPQLSESGVQFLVWSELSEAEKSSARQYFHDKVFPILTPLAVDRAHPFPFLSNLSLSVGLKLHPPKSSDGLFARIKIPDVLPQWIHINLPEQPDQYRFLSLQDLIENNLDELFPSMVIDSVTSFRVTRSADIESVSDDVEDRLDMVEEELRQRRMAEVVRLECSAEPDPDILNLLKEELEVSDKDIYEVQGNLNYDAYNEVANLNISHLRYEPWVPLLPKQLSEEPTDIFKAIREKDILVHHPYQSFTASVERFVSEAVKDPNVLAIKTTLYRAGKNNPLIPLLIHAAEKGKQVVCVIELQARFDEARNIYWGEVLEKAGVHVVYGVVGKKIHAKNILVIRKEQDSYRFYAHVGTGNYNPSTAKLYTDLGLFTCDQKITEDMIEVFNSLTGLSLKKKYKKLLVAPVNMRKKFVKLIETEIENAKNGLPAKIVAKMNSLEDKGMCALLYEASQAGVKVQLIVRGFCCLKPGIEELSENIEVRSIVGRFLEHSRIYYFQNGTEEEGAGKYFIGSADWMYRNLNNRVEMITPIEESSHKKELTKILNIMLEDSYQAWELQPDGQYEFKRQEGSEESGVHRQLMARTIRKSKKVRKS